LENLKIIAHRGASFDAPENTLASVHLAWEQNIDYVEVDVRLTKDNVLVVFHDETTIRFNQIDKSINEYSFEELLAIDVGLFKGEQWRNESIPTLEEVLKTIPTNGTLVVELKDGTEMENALAQLEKRNAKIWKQLEFISFNYETICIAKKIFPNNKCLWLLDLDYDSETKQNSPSNKDIIHKIKQHNLDGIDVFAGEMANESFFKTMHQENFEIYLWTINTVEHAKQYLAFSPHGLTTDKPKWMKEQLNSIHDK
jgi:glycerophosphoryl diester phosphodiesterase